MLPEHLLLAGIVLLIVLEIVPDAPARRARGGARSSRDRGSGGRVGSMHRAATRRSPFPGQFSVDPARALAKALVLALAVPVLLLSRDEFGDGPFPSAAAVLAVRLLPAVVGGQLPDAVPRARADVAAGVRAGAARRFAGRRAPRRRSSIWCWAAPRRAIFLMGVSLLYGGSGSLAIAGVRGGAGGRPTRWRRAAVVLVVVGVLPQGGDRAVPRLGAGCLRRREPAGDRVHGDDHQGRRAARRRCACSAPHRCRRPMAELARASCRWSRSSGATSRRCGRRASGA